MRLYTHFRSTAKRFRDFINAAAYIDIKPNDEITDILGFLAYEGVRELCLAAVKVRDAENERNRQLRAKKFQAQKGTRPSPVGAEASGVESADSSKDSVEQVLGDNKNQSTDSLVTAATSPKRKQTGDDGTFSSPNKKARTTLGQGEQDENESRDESSLDGELCSLFSMPPERHVPLTAAHVQEAFARIQRGNVVLVDSGPHCQPGGLRRTKLYVI